MLYQLFFSTTINWGECQRTSIQILNKNYQNQILHYKQRPCIQNDTQVKVQKYYQQVSGVQVLIMPENGPCDC